jgi:hypothetical protein
LGERLPLPGPYPRFGKELFAQRILASQRDTQSFSLRPRLRPWLEERSRQTIDELRDTGFDIVGDLEDLMPGEMPRTVQPDEVPEGDLAAAAVQALADLLVHHHRTVASVRHRNPTG